MGHLAIQIQPAIARFEAGGLEIVSRLSGPWIELARSAGAVPFYAPDWVNAWMRAFSPHGRVLIATAWQDRCLTGLLPLVEGRSFLGLPARTLRAPANIHSCRFDLLCSPGSEGKDAIRAIWAALRDGPAWDSLELPYVPQGGAIEALIDAAAGDGFLTARAAQYRSPYLLLDGAREAAGIPRNSHFRQNLRRRRRKAQQLFGMRLTRFREAGRVALQRFYNLEKSGWKGSRGSAIDCNPRVRQFYDGVATAAAHDGCLAIHLLEFGGRDAAGALGLFHKRRYYLLKVAYDESHRAHGPGHLLIEDVLDDIIDSGGVEFDFLGPWMDWKAEWTSAGRDHSRYTIFRPGWFGRMLFSAHATLRRAVAHPAVAALRRRVEL